MPYPMRQQPLRRRWVTVRDSRVKHFAAGVAEVLITAAGTSPFPVNKRYQLVLGEGLRQSGSQRNLSGKPVSDERRSASACALSELPTTVAMSDQLIDERIAVMKAKGAGDAPHPGSLSPSPKRVKSRHRDQYVS